ncbi:hypothetical protein J7E25_10240 [Agromyces sp. ISL-38]|uniref:hypothetical protein n=1 Tax=Agromyces sp. ISL-38 TaxID=2819107 RepID=UPI001BEBEEA1|nr:hypothetical protein [Agromyces sp. ISL-38]MBT2499480.1 hypothetical protein [Agromyces sp. ISL-38]MBT2517988.1 hypothetical protein [Streptomyces sp. ISL-90]
MGELTGWRLWSDVTNESNDLVERAALVVIACRRRLISALIVVTVAALSLTGCFPQRPVPTVADLAGRWVDSSGDGVLRLNQDGTFTAVDIPAGIFDMYPGYMGGPIPGPRVDASGTWQIGVSTPEMEVDEPLVWLNVDLGEVSATSLPLQVPTTGPPRLEGFLGDPDLHLFYTLTPTSHEGEDRQP